MYGTATITMNILYIDDELLDYLVTPIQHEPLSYIVKSDRNNDHADLVNLTYHNGNGHCSCPDFAYKKLPNINDGQPLFTTLTVCKHITLAQEYWKRRSLRDVSKIILEQNKSQ